MNETLISLFMTLDTHYTSLHFKEFQNFLEPE